MACAKSNSEGGFKCGKCRTILIIDDEGEMLLVSPDNIQDYKPKSSKNEDNTTLWHLQTDSLPEWITDAIDQVNKSYYHRLGFKPHIKECYTQICINSHFSQVGPKESFSVPVVSPK